MSWAQYSTKLVVIKLSINLSYNKFIIKVKPS